MDVFKKWTDEGFGLSFEQVWGHLGVPLGFGFGTILGLFWGGGVSFGASGVPFYFGMGPRKTGMRATFPPGAVGAPWDPPTGPLARPGPPPGTPWRIK